MSASTRAHNTLTHGQKREICQWFQESPKESQKSIMKWIEQKFDIAVGQSTVSTILKNRDRWLAPTTQRQATKKRDSMLRFPKLDEALYTWFIEHQDKVNVNGDLIREKALALFSLLYPGQQPISFSNGWLQSFKSRHNIKEYRRHGESGSVNMQQIQEQLNEIQAKIELYAREDVFNMDETGLFYRLEGDRSLATRQLEGRKGSKERITIMVCTNSDGTEKERLLVIGTSIKPRCFKNVNLNSLGITYHANKNAWMTRNVYNRWLKCFDDKMGGRKVLLLMDNFSGHSRPGDADFPVLANTEVLFLPPGTTSKLQPCDAGIIRNFKALYKRRQYRLILERAEAGEANASKISFLEAIKMAVKAWEEVAASTIKNCFDHTGLFGDTGEGSVEPTPEVIQDLQETVQKIYHNDAMNVEELIAYPGETPPEQAMTDEAIVSSIQEPGESPEIEDDCNMDDEPFPPPGLTLNQAIKMCSELQNFFLYRESDNASNIAALGKMEDQLRAEKRKSARQTLITDFVSRS